MIKTYCKVRRLRQVYANLFNHYLPIDRETHTRVCVPRRLEQSYLLLIRIPLGARTLTLIWSECVKVSRCDNTLFP